MSLSWSDHQRILRETLQICETQLQQKFMVDLAQTRRACLNECTREWNQARQAAHESISRLPVDTLPTTPRRARLQQKTQEMLTKVLTEKQELELSAHQSMIRYMMEKEELTKRYEQLCQQQLKLQQQSSQQQLQRLIASTSHTSLRGSSGPVSGATSTTRLRSESVNSNRAPRSDSRMGGSALSTRSNSSLLVNRSPSQRSSPEPSMPVASTEEKESESVGAVRTRSPPKNPRLKETMSALSTATKKSLTSSDDQSSSTSPTKNSNNDQSTDLVDQLDYGGVDELIASLNAALGSQRYHVLPEFIKENSTLRVPEHDPGRTPYARKLARYAGRTMSKVSQELNKKLDEQEEEFARRRKEKAEALWAQVELLSPKSSLEINKKDLIAFAELSLPPKRKKKKEVQSESIDPLAPISPSAQHQQRKSPQKFFPSGFAPTHAHDQMNPSTIIKNTTIPILSPTGDPLNGKATFDYSSIAETPQHKFETKLAEEAAADAKQEQRASRRWTLERKRKGAAVDTIDLFLHDSSSTIQEVGDIRQNQLKLAGANLPRDHKSVTSPTNRRRSRSGTRRDRTPSVERVKPETKLPPADLLTVQPIILQPHLPKHTGPSYPSTTIRIESDGNGPPAPKSPTVPALAIPKTDGNADSSTPGNDALHSDTNPSGSPSASNSSRSKQPSSSRSMSSSRSQPQLSSRSTTSSTATTSDVRKISSPNKHRPTLSLQMEESTQSLSVIDDPSLPHEVDEDEKEKVEESRSHPHPAIQPQPIEIQHSQSAKQLTSTNESATPSSKQTQSQARPTDSGHIETPQPESSPSASHPPSRPDTSRLGTPSSFKSRPSTGLKLSFSIPTGSNTNRSQTGKPHTPQVLQVWPENQTPAGDESSGISSDSDSERNDSSPNPSHLPQSPPLSPPVAESDHFSSVLDSMPSSRPNSSTLTQYSPPISVVQPEGPSRLDYTLASLRSQLAHKRHEVDELRQERNYYRRELDVVQAQRAHVTELLEKRKMEQEIQLLGQTISQSLAINNAATVLPNTDTYTPEDHQLNLLYFRSLYYGAAKEEKDLEFVLHQLEDESRQLQMKYDSTYNDLIRSQEHVERLAHSQTQILQQEQIRCVELLRLVHDDDLDLQMKYLDILRTIARFYSQLHGFERDLPNQTGSSIIPTCFKCSKNLVPSSQDMEMAAKLLKHKRSLIQAHIQTFANSSITLPQTTAASPSKNGRPDSGLPRPMAGAISTISLKSTTSSVRAKQTKSSADKTEWEVLDELSSLAKTIRPQSGQHVRTVAGLDSSSHQRQQLIRERSKEKFSGGSILRPTSATNTNETVSRVKPTSGLRPSSLGPIGLELARKMQSQLLAREYVQTMCNLFTHLGSGQALCRTCRYSLEAAPSLVNTTVASELSLGPSGAAGAFAPDQTSIRFFQHRQMVPLEQVRPELLQSQTATTSIRPASAITGRELGINSRPGSATGNGLHSTSSAASLPPPASSSRSHVIGQRPVTNISASPLQASTLELVTRLRQVLGFHEERQVRVNQSTMRIKKKYELEHDTKSMVIRDSTQMRIVDGSTALPAPSPLLRTGHAPVSLDLTESSY